MVANNNATENVKKIYELLTERGVEIVSVKEESGLYKILIKTTDYQGRLNVQEAFITKDGKFVTDKMILAEDYIKSLESERDFVNCLSQKGLVVAGLSSNNYTILQLSVLGNYWYKIYLDCEANIEKCQDLGVKGVPSVIYNQSVYEGVRPVTFFENLTGCLRKL
ncbi:MAG: hypothetical protein QXN71_01720 [Candidatus Aenigmatarchaeota archaeon]